MDPLLRAVTEQATGDPAGRADALLRAAFEQAAVGLAIVGADGRWVAANPAFAAMLGWSPAELAERAPFELVHPDEVCGFPEERAYRLVHRDGSTVNVGCRALGGEDGRLGWLLAAPAAADPGAGQGAALSERVREQAAIAELGQRALSTADLDQLMDAAVTMVARVLRVEFAGVVELLPGEEVLRPRAAFGWSPASLRGTFPISRRSHAGYTLGADGPVVVADLAAEGRFDDTALLARVGIRSAVSVAIPGGDAPFGVLGAHALEPQRFSAEQLAFLRSVAHIIGGAVQRQRVEERLRHQALHDAVTGLPNRRLLLDRLVDALGDTARGDAVGLLFVDVDGFELINDTHDHEAGDALLRAVGARLCEAARPSDTVARFGGDQFLIVCDPLAAPGDALRLARRVQDAFAAPLRAHDLDHQVSVGVGIAVAGRTDPAVDPHALIRDAHTALARAKERGRGRIEVHDEAIRRSLVERAELEADLRVAVREQTVELHYQPIVALDDGAPVGMEALARWTHPDRGRVPPDRFIPLAEQSDLIGGLGRQLLETACAAAMAWGVREVAVNLSPRQLADPDFPRDVERILAGTGLPAARLSLELTETALLDERTVDTLTALDALGVRLVLDDFGTGYSSLSHLRRLPIQAVKIDRAFVAGIDSHESDRAIVDGVVSLVERLGLDVVAEGVETDEQARRLRAAGCRLAQGYLFAPPLPPERAAGLFTG